MNEAIAMSPKDFFLAASIAVTFVFGQMPLAAGAEPVTGLEPAAAIDGLTPGLSVAYYDAAMSHVRQVREWARYRDGRVGAPIARFDYAESAGDVLTSGRTDEVGAWIKGLIRFEAAGTHAFEITANDGVLVEIGGQRIYRDALIHKTRTSDPIPVEIAVPGWYPIEVVYFEARNTAALEIKWRPPGTTGFVYVPAAAFAHRKKAPGAAPRTTPWTNGAKPANPWPPFAGSNRG